MTRGGRLHLRDADGVGRVPVNLRALLGARIDGLPAGSRWILQVASVIGMTFEPTPGRPADGPELGRRGPGRTRGRRHRRSHRPRHGMALQPPAHPRCGLRLDPRLASPRAPRPAGRSPRTARSAHTGRSAGPPPGGRGRPGARRAAPRPGRRRRRRGGRDRRGGRLLADGARACSATIRAPRRSGRASPCSSRRAPRARPHRRSRHDVEAQPRLSRPRPGSRSSAPRVARSSGRRADAKWVAAGGPAPARSAIAIDSSAVEWPRRGSSSAVEARRRLLDEQVGAGGDLDQPVGRAAVAAVDEVGSLGIAYVHRPGRDVVLGRVGRDGQSASANGRPSSYSWRSNASSKNDGAFAHHAGQVRDVLAATAGGSQTMGRPAAPPGHGWR